MLLTKLKTTLVALLVLAAAGIGAAAAGGWLALPGGQEQAGAFDPAGPSGQGAGAKQVEEPRDQPRFPGHLMVSQNNLKQIGLALHNFHDVNGHFPAPAIYDKAGKPLLSWRVAILPFVEHDALYRRFKLDEPWDSPHNKALLKEMPRPYAPVGDEQRERGRTFYQAIVGPGAAFEPKRPLKIADFTDGTSNTILVVEGAAPVPWTKPEDVAFVPDQALPKFGGLFQGHFNALFADGSVLVISRKANERELRKALTRADGEVLNKQKLFDSEEGRPDKPAGQLLAAENAGLKAALQRATEEVARLKKEVEDLRARRDGGAQGGNPEDAAQRKENDEMRRKLGQLLQELEALKAEKDRLLNAGPTPRPTRP
jgi:hypothetical protein